MSATALRTDALTYAPDAVIASALRLRAEGQGADRLGVRLLRNGEVLAGVYALDDVERCAAELARRNADGWHVYQHCQRVGAPITGRLLPGALGTVRTEGIAAYTTLAADIDPNDGATADVSISLAHDLATVLEDIGVPRDAILIEQSGRGGYLQTAIEQQPLSVRETMRRATAMLARMIAAADLPAHGDQAVYDPPRILRVPGTINHKSDADPTTPAWVRRPWIPGVRCPWSVVARIAAKARPKLRAAPATTAVLKKHGGDRRPLRDLFTARGWVYRQRADGVADVRCPNAEQHTDGRDGAILYPPREPGGPGWLKCSHAHCADLTVFDVYRLLEGRA